MSSSIRDKVAREVKNLMKDNGIYFFLTTPEAYHLVVDGVLAELTRKKKEAGIYISLNRGYPMVKEHLREKGADTSKLFFVYSSKEKNAKCTDCVSIQGAESLTSLSIAITTAIDRGSFNFIVLDSLNTLLVYNTRNTVQKFIYYLVGKIRAFGVEGIIIAVEGEEVKGLKPELAQLCDKCVTF